MPGAGTVPKAETKPRIRILKDAVYKSIEWADQPVIAESLFREYDLRSPTVPLSKGGKQQPAGINADGMRVLGQAYGTYVQRELKQSKIVVGNDYRSYSRGLTYAFITGVLSTGVDVVDIGTTLTQVVYFAQYHFKLPGAAMITSSHNDNGWCGIKLANGLSRTFEPKDILAFKELVYSGEFIQGAGRFERFDGIKDIYLSDVLARFVPLGGKRRLRIVVSTANGGGGPYLPELLRRMGHEIVEVNCELDWDFPKFNPNTEDIKFLHELGTEVVARKADLGVGTDGDGDRFGVVDEKGQEIFSDRAGLFLARALSGKVPNKPIVIDVKSTGAYQIDPVLKKNKARVIFSITGHSYVKAKTREVDALAGFEKSGHFFLRAPFGYGYDDGCVAAAAFCAVLSLSATALSAHIAEQPRSFQSPTMSPSVSDDKVKYEITTQMLSGFQAMQKKGEKLAGQRIKELITVNGVRFVLEDGSWGLVRASSNQPVLTIVVESFSTRKLLYQIFDEIQRRLEKYGVKRENYDQLLPEYRGE
jgi:phosphomannomutase / phosphoglucomutase